MSRKTRPETVDDVRRKLLKSSMVAGGFLAAGHIPYSKPAFRSFFGVRTAWAQPSGILTAQFNGDLPILGAQGTGQDAWELTTTQPNTTLTIDVTITSGTALPEIGLFAPGLPTTATNILTAAPGGYDGPFPVVSSPLVAAGTYTVAIEDKTAPDAAEVAFSYTIDITADMPIVPGGLVISDGPETLEPSGG